MADLPKTRRTVLLSSTTRGDPAKGLSFVEAQELPELPADHVCVRMKFAPINPSDVNICEGTYLYAPDSLPATPGLEGAGVVVAAGGSVSGVEVGDHVIGSWDWGSWAEYVFVPAKNMRVVPKEVDFKTAATIAVNPATAYGLLNLAKEGDWVIQNAANSGMGQAIIQVAKARGLKTVNIVRREGLAEPLLKLGADVVVVYSGQRGEGEKEMFEAAAKKVKEETKGAKIRLACNAVCGLSGELLAKCLAPSSTMLTYGVMSKEPMVVSGGQLLFKDITYKGFHLGQLPKFGPQWMQEMYDFLFEKAKTGELTAPEIEAVYKLEQVEEAVRHSFQSSRKGKVLLECS